MSFGDIGVLHIANKKSQLNQLARAVGHKVMKNELRAFAP